MSGEIRWSDLTLEERKALIEAYELAVEAVDANLA